MANILEEVQSYVAGKLSAEQRLSACPFIAENKKDIEYEIKSALGKQGIVGIVMTPKALYAGKFEDQSLVWQLDELEIDIIENVTVNRGKNSLSSFMTGQDAAMVAFEALCPLSGESEGQFQAVSYEEGEDNGLLVNKCVFKCLVHGGAEEPEPSPEPLQFSVVKLFAGEPPLSVTRKDGWLWPSGDQFILWSHNSPNALGDVTTQQMSAFVTQKLDNYYTKSETSSAAEIRNALESYYTKNETSSAAEISSALAGYYTKNETSSDAQISEALDSKAELSDLAQAESSLSNYLPLSGGAMSGDIVMDKGNKLVFGEHDGRTVFITDPNESDFGVHLSSLVAGHPMYTLKYIFNDIHSTGFTVENVQESSTAIIRSGDLYVALSSKADKDELSSYYTKNETSSANEISAAAVQLCSYTDSQVSSKASKSELSNYLPLSGGTVSGMTEFKDIVKFKSYIEVSGVTESPQFNLVDWDEDQAVIARLLSSGTVQLEDSAGNKAVLSVRDGSTVAYVDDISSAMSSITSTSCLSTEGFSKAGFDTDYQEFYGRGAGLVNLSSSGVLVAQTSSFTPLFGSRWQTAIYTADRIIHELSAQDEHGDLNKQELRFPVYIDGAPYHTLAIDSDIDAAVSSKADRDELSSYYTKNETSSASEISNAIALKQDKLTEQQLKRIDTDCIPLMISSNVEVSGSNYLDFNCVARFNNYSVFNGAVDTVQLNLRDNNLDTQVMLSVADEKTLLAVGGFNNELTSTLNIKNGDIAYTSDIDAAVSSLATKSELSSGLALKADISSVQSQLSGKLDKSGGTVSWLGVGRPEQRIAADQEKLGYVFSIDDYGSASLLPQMNTDVNLLMPSADGTLATLEDLSSSMSSVVSNDIDYMYDGLPDISAAADWSIAAVMEILRTAVLRWQQRHPDKVAPFVPPEPEPDE